MKVSDAKEKICPFISTSILHNEKPDLIVHCCICGDCMAWEYTWENGVNAPEDITEFGYCARLKS